MPDAMEDQMEKQMGTTKETGNSMDKGMKEPMASDMKDPAEGDMADSAEKGTHEPMKTETDDSADMP